MCLDGDQYMAAIVGGSLAIAGVMIGVLITHWLSNIVEHRKSVQTARSDIQTAFAGTLTLISVAEEIGTHDRPDIQTHVEAEIVNHGKAIETFRQFVSQSDIIAYQNAWNEYIKTTAEAYKADKKSLGGEYVQFKDLKKKIHNILSFTEKIS